MTECDTYQVLSRRTVPSEVDDLLGMAVMGLCGEAGEIIELVKKARYQGRELDVDRLKDELGDLQWYAHKVADALGVLMSEVLEENLDKLERRYPNGFSVEDSLAKRDRIREYPKTRSKNT